MTTLNEWTMLRQLLLDGKREEVTRLTQELLARNVPAETILQDGLIAGMSIVGEQMRCGEMYLPEVLQSAAAMQAALAQLKPHLQRVAATAAGKIVLGTVKGDMHDIGKNLVGIMLQGAGMEVIDLGVNVTAERFVEAVREHQPQLVGLSALLTTTMLGMRGTIDALASAGLRPAVKIIVGGAPVSESFAREIGADAYARDAVTAVDRVRELLKVA
jgi:5-methyltetrahydrofolate--homocysteine methyltransferase